jgi:hypothetical protein
LERDETWKEGYDGNHIEDYENLCIFREAMHESEELSASTPRPKKRRRKRRELLIEQNFISHSAISVNGSQTHLPSLASKARQIDSHEIILGLRLSVKNLRRNSDKKS